MKHGLGREVHKTSSCRRCNLQFIAENNETDDEERWNLFLLLDWKHCNTSGSEGLAAGAAVNCGSAHNDHMSTICEVSKNSDSDEATTMVLIKETNAQARCRRVRTKRVRLRYI